VKPLRKAQIILASLSALWVVVDLVRGPIPSVNLEWGMGVLILMLFSMLLT
jgi:hypothetical protein